MKIKTYSELMKLTTHLERYEYLKLDGKPGVETFGIERFLNQVLYKSRNWSNIRREIIIRDNACDLAIIDFPILGNVYVHHIQPITLEDVKNNSYSIFDPENLISSSHNTHNAIHYGNHKLLKEKIQERKIGDTKLW